MAHRAACKVLFSAFVFSILADDASLQDAQESLRKEAAGAAASDLSGRTLGRVDYWQFVR